MNILLHPIVVFLITGLPLVAICLEVSIQVEKNPVLVASGTDAIFTIQPIAETSLIRWTTAGDDTLAMWVNGQPVIVLVAEYQGRISVTATQFKITNSQLRDSGNYTVWVEPSSSTGLSISSRSVQLKVYDAVDGVSLILPGLPLEGKNMSLRCNWSAGTEVSVVWGKGGVALTSDTRISISAGSLVINPARRDDAGQYTCTVSNPVSARTAKNNLSVYYGPDAAQLTKTSSECVGGGDATVGQTVSLTCTSASLPPASFSWEFNGQPVTTGQTGSGALNLQIYSTNQSGRYICTAQNDITGGTSKQQMDVVIVGTCLSGGAVAGIVVACFVALIIIIIVIILLLRQRKVDQRIKEAVELQKANQSNGRTIPPPQNGNITYRYPVNGNLDPSLHTSHNQQNFTTRLNNSNGDINPLQNNGHVSTDAFQNTLSALPNNGHLNTNSYPNNNLQNSRSGQPNPNIVIQTGNSQPGAPAPTVHVNLNTVPNTEQHNNAQPHTVNVNLNTYPPEVSQRSQPESTLQRQHANVNHQNPFQTGSLSLGNPGHTEVSNTNESHRPIQSSNRTNANTNSQPSTEERPRRFIPVQMPWDRLRGTPAYPNREVDVSDSSGSSERRPRSPHDARRARSGQVDRATQHEVRLNQTADQGRPNPNVPTRPNVQLQSQMAPRRTVTQIPQEQIAIPTNLPQATHDHTTHPQTRARPDQTHPSVPLTQEALRQHTMQTDNPFTNRIQQTQAVLQNPGDPSRPSQPNHQLNKSGQRAPTPPAVLRPSEFQTLPQERAQETRNFQPARMIVRPVHTQHRHRPPDAHRQTRVWHTSPQRVPGFQPVHGHAMHVHRGQPRR